MSVRQPPLLSSTKTDILRKQLDDLYELRTHHTRWMNNADTEDYEIYRLHREILDLIKPVTHRFQALLEGLREDQEEIK